MNIRSYSVAIITTGSAGSATGSTTTDAIIGELIDVYLDFHASAPATTDTTIAFPSGGNILVVTDSSTDARIAPRQKCVDNANTAITNSFAPFVLNSPLTISLAGCDALAPAVTVTIRVKA